MYKIACMIIVPVDSSALGAMRSYGDKWSKNFY